MRIILCGFVPRLELRLAEERTSLARMASPGAKSVKRRLILISSPWKIPE